MGSSQRCRTLSYDLLDIVVIGAPTKPRAPQVDSRARHTQAPRRMAERASAPPQVETAGRTGAVYLRLRLVCPGEGGGRPRGRMAEADSRPGGGSLQDYYEASRLLARVHARMANKGCSLSHAANALMQVTGRHSEKTILSYALLPPGGDCPCHRRPGPDGGHGAAPAGPIRNPGRRRRHPAYLTRFAGGGTPEALPVLSAAFGSPQEHLSFTTIHGHLGNVD
jgi:hypothetical protein